MPRLSLRLGQFTVACLSVRSSRVFGVLCFVVHCGECVGAQRGKLFRLYACVVYIHGIPVPRPTPRHFGRSPFVWISVWNVCSVSFFFFFCGVQCLSVLCTCIVLATSPSSVALRLFAASPIVLIARSCLASGTGSLAGGLTKIAT